MSHQMEDNSNGEVEECDETLEKLRMFSVKFLRLVLRLGQLPHNVVAFQVLYRLGLAEQLRRGNGGRVGALSYDHAIAMAEQLEAAGHEPLDFSCTIMVLGKTGVGKSATINSIFDELKFNTSAFHMGTKKVQDVVGTMKGIKIRVIDTPGLLPSWSDQQSNEKILHSVKHFIKKTPPDVVLYLDRLDMKSSDFSDMPLLRTITKIFGPSIWLNTVVVLTHAASAPPDGPDGTAFSYYTFINERSDVLQQAIRQAAGDMRLMNPVSWVENHSACKTNRAGQRVLPNGLAWKPHLLMLSFASKILAEANALLKLQNSPPGKPFTARARVPPLPFLLSTLLTNGYHYLDSSIQWFVRAVLDTHGWDHDVGYEGLKVERLFVLMDKMPLYFSGLVTKDKKDANIQMEIASSVKHGEGEATSLAYTLRGETRFNNLRNEATAGFSFTLLGDPLPVGMKIEDKLVVSKRFKLVVSGGAMAGSGDIAFGGSLEAQLRDKDYPLGRSLSTLGISVMDRHGDLAVGWNVQSQIPVGRHTNLVARANLNNRGAGQISIRLNSSEQLQIALIGLIPLIKKLVGYRHQLQFGQ